jgi:hypothetical protein
MFSSLTTVLIKIFVKGFYRVHSGIFLFFFVTVLMYFFFIEVLNQTHLPPDQIVLYNLMLVLTLISSPVMVALVFIVWLGFTVRSWNYITGQMIMPSNQFLFYSSTSFSKVNQFKSWFIAQLTISLPIIAYGLFSFVIGIIFDYYIIPVVILSYVLLLSAVSALIYVRHANKPINLNSKSILSRIVGNWSKPFFSLFLYHVFDKLKVTLIVTKLLSYGIIIGSFYLLADVNDNLRVAGIVILGIVTAHAILIYQSYRFEESYLSFSRNFPYSRAKIYSNWTVTFLLLTLPENIWILSTFDPEISFALVIFNLGTGMLFRNLLYIVTLDMRKFIYWVFFIFNLFFMIILLKLFWLLVPLNIIISIIIFDRTYYRPKNFIKT